MMYITRMLIVGVNSILGLALVRVSSLATRNCRLSFSSLHILNPFLLGSISE
jgi:hypothetical protein